MKPETARVLRALFFVYAAFTFVHIAYVVYCEPYAFDAWNISVDTHAQPATIGRFFAFWHQQYTSSNPRIGQPLAYLAYKLVGVAEIGTPLAFFALVVGGFVFGARRRPRLQDNRDLAILAIGIGLLWIVAPNLPAYMFCRAYATNYIWLAAIQLWFLVPLRLMDPTAPARVSAGKLAGYFLLGVVCGMGNEHVGPTLTLFTGAYGVWIWRKHRQRPPLLWAGLAGLLTGFALIFFAPGQNHRYEGFAEHYTVIQQILVRGLTANLNIYLDLFEAAGPLLALLVCMIGAGLLTADEDRDRAEQRAALRVFVLCLAAASLITITIWASPMLGPRFYLHSMLLLLAAGLGVAAAFLRTPRALAPFVVFAVLSSGVAAVRTIPMYTRLKTASNERLARFAKTPQGQDISVEAWEQVGEEWWFLGDDLRDQKKQELVAHYFGFHRVLFRAGNTFKLLGRQDVKPTMHYEFEQPMCMDQIDELVTPEFIGRDIAALHHAFADQVAEIERFGKLKTIDLTVTFLGWEPPMPAKKLYIAKWDHGVMEGYTARLKRVGRSKQREIVLDPKLKQSPWQIYVTIVGDPPKLLGTSTDAKPFTYVPSESGQYWALACKDDYCFILLAVVHSVF